MAKIDLKLVQELRAKTGLGMMDCKKALEESGGDVEKAIELLRKKGALVAAKRSTKATAEGLVHSYIHPGSRIGVLLEINCETDFVARTKDIAEFAQSVCLQIAALRPLYLSVEDVDPKLLEREKDILKEQIAGSGKPEKIINQIIEGRLNKFYSEICLLKQTFIKNDQKTVHEALLDVVARTGENIKIKRFARFEIGA